MTKQKETKVPKRPSKKVLMAIVSDKSGKSLRELESLSRANVDTLEWVISLLKRRLPRQSRQLSAFLCLKM